MKYKELKFEGSIYTKKYEIEEILLKNNFNWFLDNEIENARIEITKDTLIFNAGIFYNGIWEYGVIRDVEWRNGTFQNGIIYNGTFKKITIENGLIFDGVFIDGVILFADIRGGTFKNINISKQTDNTTEQPQNNTTEQPQNNTIETKDTVSNNGNEIQKEVTEHTHFNNIKKHLKLYDAFLYEK